ncbi:unnamed protein product [Calicophoron daubneyi]|uniref:Uncharacterized protein n=1 Tax=Calicophoron daubneyi TaxID=300641 RepID=A0AAV2TEK0_CALDB
MLESWNRLGDAPFARVNHQAIFLNGSLYVFGGFNSQLRHITYNSYQLDVFRWDIQSNEWEELKYPLRLKAWSCSTKTWLPDPLSSPDGSINPTLRFGHTVVAWRGKGWLFGGRTQQRVCSNQLYMFEPGYCCPSTSGSGAGRTVDIIHPCWAEIAGTLGTPPTARDGHAATVLENAMFIFGGFEDVLERYDNMVYRLDFISWSWMRIQTHRNYSERLNPGAASAQLFSSEDEDHESPVEINQRIDSYDNPDLESQSDSPLPRDFACLMSHQGRIFLFGGRSECSGRSGCDVYDSALWELVPLESQAGKICVDENSCSVLQKPCCNCSPLVFHALATHGNLRRMAWEEETGNWCSPESWATCPPRPCCLWKLLRSGEFEEFGDCVVPMGHSVNGNSAPGKSQSRWRSGNAVWVKRHPGHGLQLPDYLLPRLYNIASAHRNSHSPVDMAALSSPHGRRSLSHWCYGGYLYIAFGTARCQAGEQWQLHYSDVWRFSLAVNTWSPVFTEHMMDDTLSPSARRRAVACLYLQCPRVSDLGRDSVSDFARPRVFLFGGTQPRVLNGAVCAGFVRSPLMAPARPYTLFTPGMTHAPSLGEAITQNRLLGLGDGDSVSHLNFPAASSASLRSVYTTLCSPVAILLVNSPRAFYDEQCTPFYLVVIVPPNLPYSLFSCQSAANGRCLHSAALSNLCVVSFSEVAALFRTPESSSMLEFTGYGSLDKLLYPNEVDSEEDETHMYTALRLAWTAVLTCNVSVDYSCSSTEANITTPSATGPRLQMLIVQQQTFSSPSGATSDKILNSETWSEPDCVPLILEQHSYTLNNFNGQVYHQENRDHLMQPFMRFSLLPLIRTALITMVDLLLESTKRLLTCFRQGNLRSFVLGPLVFKGTASCPYCVTSAARPIHVWIDSSQLTGLAPVTENADESTSPNETDSPSSSHHRLHYRHQTIASLLIQFLPHLRSSLESDGHSNDAQPDQSQSSANTTHSSQLLTGDSRPSSSSLSTHASGFQPHVNFSPELVSYFFSNDSVQESLANRLPSAQPFISSAGDVLAVNAAAADQDGPSSNSDEDDAEEHLLEGYGENDAVSSRSDDSPTFEPFSLAPMGTLVRGKEELMELADCYMMNLDTTLYDLCLRRLRSLNPGMMVLLTMPTRILYDLKRLYHPVGNPDHPCRKANSG